MAIDEERSYTNEVGEVKYVIVGNYVVVKVGIRVDEYGEVTTYSLVEYIFN